VTLCPRNSDPGSLIGQRRAVDQGRSSENAETAEATMVPHSPKILQAHGYFLKLNRREGTDFGDSMKIDELRNISVNGSDHQRHQHRTADPFCFSRKRAANHDLDDDLYAKRQEVGRLSYSDGSSSPIHEIERQRVRPSMQENQELFPERVGHVERPLGPSIREEHTDNSNGSRHEIHEPQAASANVCVKIRPDDSMPDLDEDDLWITESSRSRTCIEAELKVKLARDEANRFLEAFALELFDEQAKLLL